MINYYSRNKRKSAEGDEKIGGLCQCNQNVLYLCDCLFKWYMKITIEDIISAGVVPESFNNIKPGIAVFYAPEEGIDAEVKNLVIDLVEKCMKQRKGFALRLKVEATSNQMLEGCIVARRLNLGSLLQYNLLIGRMNCQESVDAFVKEFFNLTSRDDEALKFINKKKVRPQYYGYEEPSYDPTGMTLGMIVMRPPIEKEDDDDMLRNRTPEQIEDDDRLISQILDYAFKDNEEVALELLDRLSPRICVEYVKGDCTLFLNGDYELILRAGTDIKLDLTKREVALYLLLLAHPNGIVKKNIADYAKDLNDYYDNAHKYSGKDGDIGKILEIQDAGDKFKQQALEECICKINKSLKSSIRNYTSQLPFRVKTDKGILHIDFPRKNFKATEGIGFKIKE